MAHLEGISTEDKTGQLEKILHSRTLQYSESLKSLLQYIGTKVIEGEGHPNDHHLREYTIAIDVFGRGADFNASTDSVVRVQAKRLREKLKEYYENEGTSDQILVDLPKGHYTLLFSYISPKPEPIAANDSRKPIEEASAQTIPAWALANKDRLSRILLSSIVLVLALAVTFLAISNRSLRKQSTQQESSAEKASANGLIWRPFLESNLPTLLILSNPPVYRFSNAMDPEVLLENSIGLSPKEEAFLAQTLKDRYVTRQNDTPRLILSPRDYTGIGEAIGLCRVAELFRSSGKAVTLKQSRTVSAEDLKANNAVLLGSVWSNVWSGKLPVKEDFTYTLNASIINNNPQPGERVEYKPEFNTQTGEFLKDYALITVRPGVTNDSTVMVLAGIKSEGTQAAAEFVTQREYLDILNQRLDQFLVNGARPKYFQVLLGVDVDNAIPTTVSILAIHPLEVTR